MTAGDDAHERLSKALDGRRIELRMTWDDVADAAGISVAHLRRVRNGSAPLTPLVARGVEDGLHWIPGSIQRVLDGEDPVAASDTSVADSTQTASEDQAAQPRFETISGGRQDPRDYSEEQFYEDIVSDPIRVPKTPPLGWGQGTELAEQKAWAADLTDPDMPDHWPWIVKWLAVQKLRSLYAQERAERAARRTREAEQNRRRSNGA